MIYKEYTWKEGKPQGVSRATDSLEISYKIVTDPYYKRISLERYRDGEFLSLIYDSALFDFRHLKPAEQHAWQQTTVNETKDDSISYIRNQDDRLILIERHRFEEGLCRRCDITSPHGILLAVQWIWYERLGDPFNGVVLCDSNDHIIMYKRYDIDPATHSFHHLLEECTAPTLQSFEAFHRGYKVDNAQ